MYSYSTVYSIPVSRTHGALVHFPSKEDSSGNCEDKISIWCSFVKHLSILWTCNGHPKIGSCGPCAWKQPRQICQPFMSNLHSAMLCANGLPRRAKTKHQPHSPTPTCTHVHDAVTREADQTRACQRTEPGTMRLWPESWGCWQSATIGEDTSVLLLQRHHKQFHQK